MNILIQHSNTKFIQNIAITQLDNIRSYTAHISGNLYKLHYANNINSLFIVSSLITDEIRQYIAEFFQTVKIFIYHDYINTSILEEYKNICTHLVRDLGGSQNLIKIPALINNDLYSDQEQPAIKTSDMVCFLDGAETLPDKLKKFLYPQNKELKIKLFNSPKIYHAQNLGMLSEMDKAQILTKSKYFIALNNDYVLEALYKHCIVLDINELESLTPIQYTKITEHSTYKLFLQTLLNS